MSSPRILVVDDEADLRELLEMTIRKMGLDVDSAATLSQARALLSQIEYSLVLTDMRLPDGQGLDLVREVGLRAIPVAVITAFGSADNAVIALKAGAYDYVCKPLGLEQLRLLVQAAPRCPASQGRAPGQPGQSQTLRRPGARPRPAGLTGGSGAMLALRAQIARLARSMAPVAITGESGSGKELAAREIHTRSARCEQAFIAVNCGAIPEALMEAEFFGYRKGAFTGAVEEREGFFQAASGGTLMLDEVADLPLSMQVKLLRAIQERCVRKLGANLEQPVDVRIISASQQPLALCVANGSFRQDLFYRLNVIELALPPLRERLDDLPALTASILQRLASVASHGAPRLLLGAQVLETLRRYAFPGNVRELENILERALAFSDDGVIQVCDLVFHGAGLAAPAQALAAVPQAIQQQVALLPVCLPAYLDAAGRDMIVRALTQTGFRRSEAAQLLGISLRQLRYQIKRLAIFQETP